MWVHDHLVCLVAQWDSSYGLITEKQHFMAHLKIKKVLTYKPMGLYSNIKPIFDNKPMGFYARGYGTYWLNNQNFNNSTGWNKVIQGCIFKKNKYRYMYAY